MPLRRCALNLHAGVTKHEGGQQVSRIVIQHPVATLPFLPKNASVGECDVHTSTCMTLVATPFSLQRKLAPGTWPGGVTGKHGLLRTLFNNGTPSAQKFFQSQANLRILAGF